MGLILFGADQLIERTCTLSRFQGLGRLVDDFYGRHHYCFAQSVFYLCADENEQRNKCRNMPHMKTYEQVNMSYAFIGDL